MLMAALFVLYIIIRCKLNPALAPPMPAEERALVSWPERFRLLRAGLLPVFIFVAMMVPFLNGWASLTEASVIGALASVAAALLKGRFTRAVFETATRQTLMITVMFMMIITAALSFGAVFDGLGAGRAINNFFLNSLGLAPWQVLVLMQASFLVMGMFLDDTAMLVIVAPVYVSLAKSLGFDLVWYGVLYTITCQIAYLTPPFGYNLFLMKAMAPPEFTLPVIYRSVFPFVLVMILTLVLVMVFPELALWLPREVLGR
ncbi:hypothetical protein SDC9_18815 [bioreactor metagenome]|uniref:TRAP C4-dicarboxylate transport system permease DctM subunit domain-containing protein n=1 Tax=bioreactor metagenome TaxID=1076179 RepID=A0A644U3E6_9ZZZZ